MVINSIETRFSRNVSAARLLKKTMINQSVVRSGLLSISRMSKITLTKQTGNQMLLFLWFFSFNTHFEILFFQIFHTTFLLKNCSSQMNSSNPVTPCPAIIISSWFFSLILVTFVFSMLIVDPTRVASASILAVLSWISCLVEDLSTTSSA